MLYNTFYNSTLSHANPDFQLGVEALGLTSSLLLLLFGMIIIFVLIQKIRNKP